jgi:quinol monooxygenase YgiN
MQRGTWLGLAVAVMLAATAEPAAAQSPAAAPAAGGPVYMITFFELGSASADRALAALRQYTTESRKAEGSTGALALRETGRPGRFALVEVWRDKPAAETHRSALSVLGEKLSADLTSPFDTRSNTALEVAGPAFGAEPDPGNSTVYVLTHVDVFPAGKDQTIEMLKQLAAESRKEPGNLRLEILQQEGRLNHLPVVEAWRDARAQDAHVMAAHTRAFRAKLVPLQGALYDERLYEPIR